MLGPYKTQFKPLSRRRAGEIVVSVREKEGVVEISVKDEGPGIAQDDRGKLFQKFQRLTSRPTGGETSTGLGLYLIQAMVNKMQGEILCLSEEGKGATFTVRLKALKSPETPPLSASERGGG